MSNIIEIRDLHYSYPPQAPKEQPIAVLKGINLTVERGEFVSVMGPTGVGKTTLCLAMNGIIPHSTGGVYQGEVIVDGLLTSETPVAHMAHKVGIVFQDPESQLFNMTIEDEIAFGLESLGLKRDIIGERIQHVLKVVRMEGLGRRSPFHLSGGQKQRVAIASILAMEPEVLILDEPTSGLDPVGKMEVFSVVEELRQVRKMTIIMVEQESEKIAEFSDRVIIIDQGRVALEGKPRDVFCKLAVDNPYGVAVPQVAELGCCLETWNHEQYGFVTREQAFQRLRKEVLK